MARNDGIDHSFARDGKYTRSQIGNIERHNERKNEIYQNTDIQLERSDRNIYFKKPTDGYIATFDQMCKEGTISTKGLKDNAIHFGELLFDVNTSYFEERGGYEFAKEFYSKAYDYAAKEVGGEQYILSAVMHADERNSAMSEQLGKDVYHYHMHVIYIPVVQKEVKWSKRCKDKSLVGTVKEVITQVSHSKKWASHKEIDEDGKSHLVPSYSLLQDRFFEYMRDCGYKDIERGEKGSTDKHKNEAKFKADQEEKRLNEIISKVEKSKKDLENVADKKTKIKSIDSVETKSGVMDKSKVVLDKSDFEEIKTLAKKHIVTKSKEQKLLVENKGLKQENKDLMARNTRQTLELNEYKSVRNQLNVGKDKIRLSELEKFQETVYRFLDKLGLKKQFEDFVKLFQRQRNEVER
ncbi:plasmid recombination protein [Anaerotignum sp.]|uniref:plasmid recombination protein n=1 Tax=Anaerotignum sp. TaxID=2039241 RepID=UPI0028B1CE9D|nr:plasmid recombination protein [Anaerotignum sp.]